MKTLKILLTILLALSLILNMAACVTEDEPDEPGHEDNENEPDEPGHEDNENEPNEPGHGDNEDDSGELEYELNGDGQTYTLVGIGTYRRSELVIPGEHEGKKVTSVGFNAFGSCTDLTSVTFPDTLTSIGVIAFGDCTGLTSIAIPDSVTSIGVGAFYGCTGLTSITIPDSVTSIGVSAFSGWPGLTSISVSENNPVFYSKDNCLIEKRSNTLFLGCKTSVIPDGVTSIGEYGISDFNNLKYVIFLGTTSPSSSTTVLSNCNLVNVYVRSSYSDYYFGSKIVSISTNTC